MVKASGLQLGLKVISIARKLGHNKNKLQKALDY